MAGTINLALSQQFDSQGRPLAGGLLYFYQAASTTPQSAFNDTALTIELPNPIVLDASGRIPMFYLANTTAEGNASGQIKIRLTDESGVVIIAADSLLIIGPAGEGGSAGAVDETKQLQTGDIKARFGTGTRDGFVRCNGRTIGPEGSGASEATGDQCEELFKYLWNLQLDSVGVEPVRGANAVDDWAGLDGAKRVILPDLRGRTLAGMDDMGATAIGRLTSTYFGVAATTLGAASGSESHALTELQVAAHTHTGTAAGITETMDLPNHKHSGDSLRAALSIGGSGNVRGVIGTPSASGVQAGSSFSVYADDNFGVIQNVGTLGWTGATDFESASHNHDFSDAFTTSTGEGLTAPGSAHANVQPTLVLTWYIKL